MTTDPTTLMAAARCFKCLTYGMQKPVDIYLLCAWANLNISPSGPFSFTPSTATIAWVDANGSFSGNLAYFQGKAAFASVSSISFIGQSSLTSINGSFASFPNLSTLVLYNCANLAMIPHIPSLATGLTIYQCTSLTSVVLSGSSYPGGVQITSVPTVLTYINFNGASFGSGGIACTLDSQLSSIANFVTCVFTAPSATVIDFSGCALGSQNVEDVLSVANASGLASGSAVYLQGGTNSPPPNGNLNNFRGALIARGCSVLNN